MSWYFYRVPRPYDLSGGMPRSNWPRAIEAEYVGARSFSVALRCAFNDAGEAHWFWDDSFFSFAVDVDPAHILVIANGQKRELAQFRLT